MDQLYKITLKAVVVGALIVIPVVYFSVPPQTAKASDLGNIESVSPIINQSNIGDNVENATESVPLITIQSENGDKSENNSRCQYDSKGVISQWPRKSKPGLLKDVREINVANESIFFIETSCSADLNSRQSCAVESAARANPEKQVYMLFISPDANLGPNGGQNIRKLKSIYTNIHFHYLDIINYTKGTKMEKWVENQTLTTSSFKVAHLSDGLRFLTLCKYGGIYMDLDVVVIHSFKNMSNFAGYQSDEEVNNAVMSMKANGTLVNACLNEYVNNYRGDLWSHNGPGAVGRALKETCERKTSRLWKNCDGTFLIYPPTEFYPIPWEQWHIYFEEGSEQKIDQLLHNSTAVHVWNKMSAEGKVRVGSNIIYGDIAGQYCPLSYWNSGQFF